MKRTKWHALCFCLVLAEIAAPSPLSAQEPLRTRFLTDGPKGWKALEAAVRKLEGTFVGRYKLGVHPPIIEEVKFKVNGEFLVYEEIRREENGKIDRVIAPGANSKYRFTLQQKRPPSSWVLADHGPAEDPLRFDHPYSRALGVGFLRFLRTPLTVNTISIPEMASESGFKLGRVEDVTRDGKKLAKIEFTYAPPKVTPDLVNGRPVRRDVHLTKMRGGWMLLDPERNWSLQESSLDLEGGEKNTCIVEYAEADGGLLLPSRIIEKDNAESAWEVTFSGLTIRDIPEEEFTLTAYGLPEPVGVVWPKPTRWWLWISAAALATTILGFGLRKLQWRFQRSAPAEAKTGPKEG